MISAVFRVAAFFVNFWLLLSGKMKVVKEDLIRIHLKGGGHIDGWFMDFETTSRTVSWRVRGDVLPKFHLVKYDEIAGWVILRRRHVLAGK